MTKKRPKPITGSVVISGTNKWEVTGWNKIITNIHESTRLIKYVNDPVTLRRSVGESLYQAISLFSKETPEINCKIIMNDLMDDCQYDPIELVAKIISDIRKGKRKVYGMVTPNDIFEMLNDERVQIAITREQDHSSRKGYSNISRDRVKGRLDSKTILTPGLDSIKKAVNQLKP